ncbi:uncharacterized protein LOC110843626 [Folsomia candida]|uniref:N-lysine methyltransferase SMYD2-A n=1 Tax=Folsomia candida TaxID=158441 RepID=A0A226EXL6_FOLCA|nr:uncharacterized protein LOC110843626 [Folsomia candida]OXA61356.1 N-lysine methyltransferase SMYD2-A [Folsomia candida]
MGPKKMQPPQPGQKRKGAVAGHPEKGSILRDTTRGNVISVMNRIHREVIDPKKFEETRSRRKERELMVLQYPDNNHSEYDESMEVELKMENCVSIDTLVKNVGQVLKGKFLLCRTITPSSKMVGVDAGVEDVKGEKAMRLAFFNYSVDARMGKSDFETVLPLGMMLIVKNPVFKKPIPESPNFGLIVDNPADVELLSPKRMEALFPDVHWKSDLPVESRALFKCPLFWEFFSTQSDLQIATKLKNVGNKAFVENRTTDAIRFYDLAFEYILVEEEEAQASSALLMDILSNKAASLIKLECFNSALICTEKVLGINSGHVKAIYRHAKALIGLGRYSEADKFLDEKLKQLGDEENKDILRLRSVVPDLLKPPGKEIIRTLRTPRLITGSDQPQPDLPVGMADRISEFLGPIELGKSKICDGDGLFATEDLEPGTILLVGKPFSALYVPPEDKEAFLLNTTTHSYHIGVIANKIWLDPDLGRDLYKLWAGPDLKPLLDNADPKITKVDIARINKICDYNVAFSYGDLEKEETYISEGVYPSASKINHSCIDANVIYAHHDSSLVMTITTFKQVKKGEEILMSYVDVPLPSEDFMEIYGFICNCRLCELDRSESPVVLAKRENLLESLAYNKDTKRYLFHPLLLANDLAILCQLERLRAETPDLNFAMAYAGIYKIASLLFELLGRYPEALSILEKTYAVYQNLPTNINHPKIVATILACCVKMNKEKGLLEKWTEELRKNCRLYAGTLEHVRKLDHPTLPEDLRKFGIEFFNEMDY